MTSRQNKNSSATPDERRSSVRVNSLLPCAVEPIEAEQIPAMRARILDMAVIESDGALQDAVDWSERAEELPREVFYMLNEVRALRQQLTEIRRLVERDGEGALTPRWVSINDRGFQYTLLADDLPPESGDFLEVKVRIPSLHNPDILALGEVVRIDEDEGERSVAVVFRAISELHKKAILRYAVRHERQLARSSREPLFLDDGLFGED